MTDEYMTLAEALATGLPFKHNKWGKEAWVDNGIDGGDACKMYACDFFEPVWEVKQPKTKLKVWRRMSDGLIVISDNDQPYGEYEDFTTQLRDLLKGEE